MAATIRIGDLYFNETSGEIFRMQGDATESVGRLPPQPTQLLSLLVANHPEITTHESIRQSLWPGIGPGFQKNMHFCVRQIRSVLGDPASSSCYIATVPRRGYRFATGLSVDVIASRRVEHALDASRNPESPQHPKLDPVTPRSDAAAKVPETSGRAKQNKWGILIAAASMLLMAGVFLFQLNGHGERGPVRVAVMTFEPAGSPADAAENDIAETIVERLTNDGRPFQVIGPTTTARFKGLDHFGPLFEELDVDYVINARVLASSPDRMLAEIIRRSDGVHVWVGQLAWATDADVVANTLTQGFFSHLRDGGR